MIGAPVCAGCVDEVPEELLALCLTCEDWFCPACMGFFVTICAACLDDGHGLGRPIEDVAVAGGAL
jgi:hypothetical protein